MQRSHCSQVRLSGPSRDSINLVRRERMCTEDGLLAATGQCCKQIQF